MVCPICGKPLIVSGFIPVIQGFAVGCANCQYRGPNFAKKDEADWWISRDPVLREPQPAKEPDPPGSTWRTRKPLL